MIRHTHVILTMLPDFGPDFSFHCIQPGYPQQGGTGISTLFLEPLLRNPGEKEALSI